MGYTNAVSLSRLIREVESGGYDAVIHVGGNISCLTHVRDSAWLVCLVCHARQMFCLEFRFSAKISPPFGMFWLILSYCEPVLQRFTHISLFQCQSQFSFLIADISSTSCSENFAAHHTLLYLPSDFSVAYAANISDHLTIRWEIDYHTGNYIPYSLRTVCPTELIKKSFETGRMIYRPYPRRLDNLTICRWCNRYKGSTFSSVI